MTESILNFPGLKQPALQKTVRVFEFDNGGELDWVLAEDQDSALVFLKEFHEEDDEELLPGVQGISFKREITGEDLKTQMMIVHPEEGDKEYESNFHDFIESMKLDENFILPTYLCGTMFV